MRPNRGVYGIPGRFLVPLVATFGLCACGGPEGGSASGARGATASLAPIVPVTAEGIRSRVAQGDRQAVLVNVWATWCVPCREEFPDLVRLHRELSDEGLSLFFVSADFDTVTDVRGFLTEQGVDFETYWKNENDMQFIDGMNPEWSGALPASFLYDGSGSLRRFWQGKASYEELRAEIVSILEESGATVSSPNGGIGS